MIKTIFLDMDGVIVNFNKAVCEQFDLSYPPQVYHFFPDIRDEVNRFCDRLFWRNLEWTHDGREILRAIMDTLGLEKICFLTGMMPNIESATGKMAWIQDNLPVYRNRIILHSLEIPKSSLAQPDTLLIDDKDENVDEFIVAGGVGILVPRPWNKNYEHSDVSANVVKECLETLC